MTQCLGQTMRFTTSSFNGAAPFQERNVVSQNPRQIAYLRGGLRAVPWHGNCAIGSVEPRKETPNCLLLSFQ